MSITYSLGLSVMFFQNGRFCHVLSQSQISTVYRFQKPMTKLFEFWKVFGIMGMIIGYARVSTADQKLDAQINALSDVGAERLFSETISGATAKRPELQRMLDQLDIRINPDIASFFPVKKLI